MTLKDVVSCQLNPFNKLNAFLAPKDFLQLMAEPGALLDQLYWLQNVGTDLSVYTRLT